MGRTPRVLAIAAVAIALFVGSTTAGAGGTLVVRASPLMGGDFRVSGPSATANEGNAELAWNETADQYLVVWEDQRNFGTRGGDIYGRQVGPDGRPIGADFRISGPSAVSNESLASVVWNQTANEYLVVWNDGRSSWTRGMDVYGRRVSASGTPIGDDFRISGPSATSNESYTALAWNQTANEYLVVWGDDRSFATRDADVYGRRVSASGTPIGDDFRMVGPNATAADTCPRVAWNQAANEYLVVWSDKRNYSTRGWDTYGRRVSASGTPIGGDFRISGPNATAGDLYPAVARNETADEYLVVWHDGRNLATRGWDIYGRRVGSDGKLIGGELRISGSKATSDEYWPSVAWNQTANQYLVVWEDWRNLATRAWDIYGRRVGSDGKPVGGDFRISGPNATLGDSKAGVVWNQTVNQYLVVWEDQRNSATRGMDIYGRRVTG